MGGTTANSQSSVRKLPYIRALVSWEGIAWIVAFLAGFWGVMIGTGNFGLSAVCFLFCGAMVIAKIGYETMRDWSLKRIIASVAVLIVVVVVEYGTIHWTNGLSVEASEQQARLSKLDQIPQLTQQLIALKQQEAIDRAKDQQQISDIGRTNDQLKASIEKKDAVLAAIARQQYALNFVPQVIVSATGTTNDQVLIQNNGKTNIDVTEIDVEGRHQDVGNAPAFLINGAMITFTLNPRIKDNIATRTLGGNADRLPVECELRFTTMDNKDYSLKFTWFFTIKNGSIVSTAVIDRPIDEIK